jgi:hypothetical protein
MKCYCEGRVCEGLVDAVVCAPDRESFVGGCASVFGFFRVAIVFALLAFLWVIWEGVF